MRLRNIALCALSLLLPVLRVSAQTSAPSGEVTGATVRVTSIDTANNKYTYEIWNKSNREITTYSFLEKFTYSDGSTNFFAHTHDSWMANIDGSQPKFIEPGETRIDQLSTQGDGAVKADLTLLLLVYSDLTAEVRSDHGERFTGDQMFRIAAERRKGVAQGCQIAIEAMTRALNGKNNSPAAVALQTLQTSKSNVQPGGAQRGDGQSNPSNHGLSSTLTTITGIELDYHMTVLRGLAGSKEERKDLARHLAATQARAKLASERAQLRRLP